jgi:hypothetical protein
MESVTLSLVIGIGFTAGPLLCADAPGCVVWLPPLAIANGAVRIEIAKIGNK